MFRRNRFATAALMLVGSAQFLVPQGLGQTTIQGGEVNVSGATLFRSFFQSGASTNDFIDVDGDGCAGFFEPNSPCGLATGTVVDQLAPLYTCPSWTGWWLMQDRGVGSINGVTEFIDFQLEGTIPTSVPGEVGLINRLQFAANGVPTATGCSACNTSNTPECPSSIDLAITDVEGTWAFVAGDPNDAFWSKKPAASGYGQNYLQSSTGYVNQLASLTRGSVSLNTNTASPDHDTIYDTTIAWSPIVYCSNRGTGYSDFRMTELQHLLVAGRMPNGENLAAITRSAGSGTRNGEMNTSGIDPSWGRGDNIGNENAVTSNFALSPNHQPTNGEGSSQVEQAMHSRRLGVGYTGLSGSDRAMGDSIAGRYEIVNVMFDDRGGSAYVRPSKNAILDGCDPDTGYMLGGNQTFISRGTPDSTNSGDDEYMDNQAAADYLRNITDSIAAVVTPDPNLPNDLLSPGDFLAKNYFLLAGMDCLTTSLDPVALQTNAGLIQTVQDLIRNTNELGVIGSGGHVPAYGSVNTAGQVPNRLSGFTYSDGSSNGNYVDFSGNYTVVRNTNLSERNRIAGDFDNDGDRDAADIVPMMDALFNPRAFVTAEGAVPGNPGSLGTNYVIPEIIGDHNGDGDFDADDARYAADGLAIVEGVLDRTIGYTNVDTGWAAVAGGDNNYFNTTLVTGTAATPKLYNAGDSRADVAGSGSYNAGGLPVGHDLSVDVDDIDYVFDNFGNWGDLDVAVFIDLSCDMNGDLVIDMGDITDIVVNVLGTRLGDINFDRKVDLTDLSNMLINFGASVGSYANGDLNGDGIVNLDDLSTLLVNFGFSA